MKWLDFNEAFKEAENSLRVADDNADRMAGMLIGRLRKVNGWTLASIKRELKNFNPQRRTWKP